MPKTLGPSALTLVAASLLAACGASDPTSHASASEGSGGQSSGGGHTSAGGGASNTGGVPGAGGDTGGSGAQTSGGGGSSPAGTGGSTGGSSNGSGGGAPAADGQLVVLDTSYTHDVQTMAFSFFDVPATLPSDLTGYTGGRLYQRVKVEDKPSGLGVSYQMCFFQDQHTADKHACSDEMPFTGPGEYQSDQELQSLWQFGVIDWSRALLDLMLVVKDVNGNPVDTRYGFDGAWQGSPDLSLYYPMKVRFTAVLVAPGATFQGFPQ